jgi:hypothetical protein
MGLLDAARKLFSASAPVAAVVPARKKTKRKINVTPAVSRPTVIEELKAAAIEELKAAARARGYKNLTVTTLLARFGYRKRSEANLKFITASLAAHDLTVYPVLSMSLKLSQSVRIYSFPVEQLGHLFEDPETAPTVAVRQQRERALEEYIERHDLFTQLGLVKECRQYSPKHTQDRFDFLCRDAAGAAVVLELKHAGGGKSAVEQILRYLGMLRQEAPDRPARGILITGVRDVDTAKALHGMAPAQQQVIDWYLYRYDRYTGVLSFEKVEYAFIAEHLHRAWHVDAGDIL